MIRSVLAVFAFCASASVGLADTYVNDRFGIVADIPDSFRTDPDWDSRDGQRFLASGNASLIVWGVRTGVDYRDIRDFRNWWAETFRASGEITYEAGKDEWYVLSGYEDGRIFYLRVEEGKDCRGDPILAAFLIRYWPRQRDRFDDRIKPLAQSLTTGACD